MKFIQSSGHDFPLQPDGPQIGVLFQIIDMGTQEITWEGATKQKRQMRLVFELHGEGCQLEDGRPMAISKTFTNSGHEKSALRLFMEQWRGRKFTDEEIVEFDFRNMLHKPCILTIQHKEGRDSTMALIGGVSRLMNGMAAPTPVNPTLYVSLEAGEYNAEDFNKLPAKLKEKIWQSPEYKALMAPHDSAPWPEDA